MNTLNTNNLFNFDYEVEQIKNRNSKNDNSRFSVVFGQNGNVVHTKKDSYSVVKTADFSKIGNAFKNNNYNVNTFVEKNGEVIGISIDFLKHQQTEIGEKAYKAVITLPNNGGGRGYLSIFETRLICTNGMVHSKVLNKDFQLKIPHTIDYMSAINLMTESIDSFTKIIVNVEKFDSSLNSQKLENEIEAIKILNKWFFENEFPNSQKNGMTFNEFRENLAIAPENIKCIERYEQLKKAFYLEVNYNKELNLELTNYTVYASVTNYLSRRIEQSKSSASQETQYNRSEKKIEFFKQYV